MREEMWRGDQLRGVTKQTPSLSPGAGGDSRHMMLNSYCSGRVNLVEQEDSIAVKCYCYVAQRSVLSLRLSL